MNAEAMANALPIVAFDISSNAELIKDKHTGLLVPFNNTIAFADALELLINSTDKQNALGIAGKRRTTELFDNNNNKTKLIAFITEG